MKCKQVILVTSLLLIVLLPGNIWGQEEKEAPEDKSDISLFLGASSSSNETAFTIGMDYQYRISRVFGVGVILDYAGGDIRSTLVAPSLFMHLKKLSFTLAPGAEFSGDETVMVLRVGAVMNSNYLDSLYPHQSFMTLNVVEILLGFMV